MTDTTETSTPTPQPTDFNELIAATRQTLKEILDKTSATVDDDLDALAAYTTGRMEALARAVGEPGFAEAVEAATESIAIRAGLIAVEEADLADYHARKVLASVLTLGARALVLAVT